MHVQTYIISAAERVDNGMDSVPAGDLRKNNNCGDENSSLAKEFGERNIYNDLFLSMLFVYFFSGFSDFTSDNTRNSY